MISRSSKSSQLIRRNVEDSPSTSNLDVLFVFQFTKLLEYRVLEYMIPFTFLPKRHTGIPGMVAIGTVNRDRALRAIFLKLLLYYRLPVLQQHPTHFHIKKMCVHRHPG